MELTIGLEEHPKKTLLILAGDINSGNVHILENTIESAINLNSKHIELDCTSLNSTSMDGLSLLFECQVQLQGHFFLSLSNVSSNIVSLMELSGITYFIKITSKS